MKSLEEKNENLMQKCLHQNELNSNKEVIIGLRRVIEEKEKMINNLYNSYDKLSIKYEDIMKKNEMLRNENSMLKNRLNTFTSSSIPQLDNNNNFNNTSSIVTSKY